MAAAYTRAAPLGSFDFARDFACGLPLRSRPQTGSTFTAVTRVQFPQGDARILFFQPTQSICS